MVKAQFNLIFHQLSYVCMDILDLAMCLLLTGYVLSLVPMLSHLLQSTTQFR